VTAQARRAEALGARLPPLLVAARRVAATVAGGMHGRRRFWQYRPALPGETRHDPRASAKAVMPFVRETEWEAAQTVLLWRDGSASMQWRSGAQLPLKAERAELLLLAVAALLLRGGELVRLLGGGARARSGRGALEAIAAMLGHVPTLGLPAVEPVPRYARAVLIGDFLAPLEEVRGVLEQMAAAGVGGHLVQVLDPAEAALPYAGRVRFRGLEGEADSVIGSAEGIRGEYAAALAGQQRGLAGLCAAAGWSFAVHRTDQPAAAALLGLHAALSG